MIVYWNVQAPVLTSPAVGLQIGTANWPATVTGLTAPIHKLAVISEEPITTTSPIAALGSVIVTSTTETVAIAVVEIVVEPRTLTVFPYMD
jgi:hypothetical protein